VSDRNEALNNNFRDYIDELAQNGFFKVTDKKSGELVSLWGSDFDEKYLV